MILRLTLEVADSSQAKHVISSFETWLSRWNLRLAGFELDDRGASDEELGPAVIPGQLEIPADV